MVLSSVIVLVYRCRADWIVSGDCWFLRMKCQLDWSSGDRFQAEFSLEKAALNCIQDV
jgi:hypothetical protein